MFRNLLILSINEHLFGFPLCYFFKDWLGIWIDRSLTVRFWSKKLGFKKDLLLIFALGIWHIALVIRQIIDMQICISESGLGVVAEELLVGESWFSLHHLVWEPIVKPRSQVTVLLHFLATLWQESEDINQIMDLYFISGPSFLMLEYA